MLLEEKPAALALHYRNADVAASEAAIGALLHGPAKWSGVHVRQGKMVVEFSVVEINKGVALDRIRQRVVGCDALVADCRARACDAQRTRAQGALLRTDRRDCGGGYDQPARACRRREKLGLPLLLAAAMAASALLRLGASGPGIKLLDWILGILDHCEPGSLLCPLYTVTVAISVRRARSPNCLAIVAAGRFELATPRLIRCNWMSSAPSPNLLRSSPRRCARAQPCCAECDRGETLPH